MGSSIGPTALSAIGPAAAAMAIVVAGAAAHPRAARTAAPRRSRSVPGKRLGRRTSWILSALLLAVVLGPIAAGATLAVAMLLRQLAPLRSARRRRAAVERMLPDAMDRLVLSVRAGLTPFQAVCDLAESDGSVVGEAFGEVVRRTQRGHAFADALVALPERLGVLAGGLADVIATSDRHGLPLGPVLDELTRETRAARRRLDQAEARKLPVRLSFPLVTCTLPSFVLLAIAPGVIAALSSLGGTAW